MKKLTVVLSAIFLSIPLHLCNAVAFDPSSITFSITSAAVTSSPNLRIGVVKGNMAKDGNIAIQGLSVPTPANYYLTKSIEYTFTTGTYAIEIQADQDTKMYVGSDLTNYLLIYSGVPRIYTVR